MTSPWASNTRSLVHTTKVFDWVLTPRVKVIVHSCIVGLAAY